MIVGNKTYFSPKRYMKEIGFTKSFYVIHTVNGRCLAFFHRKTGPAYISYKSNIVQWARHDSCCRIDGPADTAQEKLSWYFEGDRLLPSEEMYWNA